MKTVRHNEALKLGPNLYVQYVSPPGDARRAWRIMDKFGNGILVEGDAITNLTLALGMTPTDPEAVSHTHVIHSGPEPIDGCDIGTVTGMAPAA